MNNQQNNFINLVGLGVGIWALYIAYKNLYENEEQSLNQLELLNYLEEHMKKQDEHLHNQDLHLIEQDKLLGKEV